MVNGSNFPFFALIRSWLSYETKLRPYWSKNDHDDPLSPRCFWHTFTESPCLYNYTWILALSSMGCIMGFWDMCVGATRPSSRYRDGGPPGPLSTRLMLTPHVNILPPTCIFIVFFIWLPQRRSKRILVLSLTVNFYYFSFNY